MSDTRKKVSEAEQAMEACAALEGQFAHLRASWDMFFLGQDRAPPTKAHEALKKKIRAIKETHVQQTSARFRIDSLDAKFNTYDRLWHKNLQEMESGTFRRDLVKMKRKNEEPMPRTPPESLDPGPTETMPAAESASLGEHVPVATQLGQDAAPTLGAAPVRPRPKEGNPSMVGPATATAQGGLSDERLKALYNAYLAAKKRCNEDVSKLTFENMASTLKKQVPALLKHHNTEALDFKVIIKDGKAVLRAVPKAK